MQKPLKKIQDYTSEDIDLLEDWWIQKSRRNFLAYRMFMRNEKFLQNWFIVDLCKQFQQFYVELKKERRPILLIQSPPQHGKSWTVADFISWISGIWPELRTIYGTYSDTLGVRCNLSVQRQMDSLKYQKIFSDIKLSSRRGEAIRTTKHLEFIDSNGNVTDGQFRNTTTGGPITGETLDLGIIDDAVKGREQASSITWSQKIWEWFTDDFQTRFSDKGGLLIIMTRWTTHDVIARLVDKIDKSKYKLVNYQAIATKDEEHRREGQALFPQLKSLDFLEGKKELMAASSFESLYQGNPTVSGGNLFKDKWWQWYKDGVLPQLKYKFITADTAQETKTQNDWTIFQAWGYGIDDKIYLLDKVREKFEAPELRREAEMFYQKHNTPRLNVGDPTLRGMYIEKKSSGAGLLQELKRKNVKVIGVERSTDKVFRAEDASPYVEAGKVVISTSVNGTENLTKEAREFPNGEFDDDIDTLMTAIEVTFINKNTVNSLEAAMSADD